MADELGCVLLIARQRIWVLSAVFCALIFGAIASVAEAGFFTKIMKEAGEAGGSAARHGIGVVDDVARVVRSLPEKPNVSAIGAHATPEGHWTFVNRKGEQFTAGNADELARFADSIAPDYASGRKHLELHLSEDTVFNRRAMLKDLPEDATLHMTSEQKSYPIGRPPKTDTEILRAEIRPNVAVNLTSAEAFKEALWQLQRQLNAADIRVFSLLPGSANSLPATPRFDAVKKAAMVDVVDPWKLDTALKNLRGQTVIVTGRVEQGKLFFKPKGGGGERPIGLNVLTGAARSHDVNLVVLNATATQPGGRNWFWQKVTVDGLDDAVRRATFADFLNALGVGRGQFQVTAQGAGSNRVTLQIVPDGKVSEPISGTLEKWVDLVVAEVTGNVITSDISVHANDRAYQKELDSRIISWLPSVYQYGYVIWMLMGLFGISFVRSWWLHVWPPEERKEYRNVYGYWAARSVRMLVFIFLFLPIVGVPAFFFAILDQLLGLLLIPVRMLSWMFRKIRGSA